ncbi:MAG TPA: CBS domain-containing protein [Actinomycetota bacterium]
MKDEQVGSLVVLDERERMVGIVTDRDLVIRGLAAGLESDPPIEKVMSRDVSYVFDNADVCTASTEMAARGIRRLPVLDRRGHLCGLVSFDDLIVGYSEEIDRLARAVRKELLHAPLP